MGGPKVARKEMGKYVKKRGANRPTGRVRKSVRIIRGCTV